MDSIRDNVSDFRHIDWPDVVIEKAAWEEACAYQEWYARLSLLAAKKAPIEKFVEVMVSRLSNPAAIIAGDGSVLAHAGEFTGPIEGTIWERLESGSLEWGFYSRQDQERLTRDSLRATRPTVMRPSVDPDHEYLSAYVRVRGSIVASIGLVDVNAPITRGQVQTIADACELLGVYLENNDLYLRLARSSTAIIRELVEGGSVPAEAVSYWLAERSLPTGGPFRLFVCLNPHRVQLKDEVAPFMRELGKLVPQASLVPVGETVLALMPEGDGVAGPIDTMRHAIERIGIACGYAPAVRDPLMLRTHYIQALEAAQEAARRGIGVVGFESCTRVKLHELLASAEPPLYWCDPGVRALWEIGESGRELVSCLWSYLVNGRNVAAASRKLHVHRNTLIYRLGRIERELALSFDGLDEDKALFLLASCLTVMDAEN